MKSSSVQTDLGLTKAELRKLRSLNTPAKIQRYLDALPYHHAGTAWSPRYVLMHEMAHCLEGALLAAAALRANGFAPLIFDLEAVRDDDHVLAIYRIDGHWGAIGKSNYSGLRFREPVYRSLRELALSYFESYYNLRGERTLRGFSKALDLARFDYMNWMTTDEPLWAIPELLVTMPHYPLINDRMAARLSRLDKRSFLAGLVGHLKK